MDLEQPTTNHPTDRLLPQRPQLWQEVERKGVSVGREAKLLPERHRTAVVRFCRLRKAAFGVGDAASGSTTPGQVADSAPEKPTAVWTTAALGDGVAEPLVIADRGGGQRCGLRRHKLVRRLVKRAGEVDIGAGAGTEVPVAVITSNLSKDIQDLPVLD